MNIIIGFSGLPGCGKDYAADYLVNRYGFTRLAFADHLKNICAKLANEDLSIFNDRERKEIKSIVYDGEKLSPREMLHKIGTEMRSNDDEYFINYVLNQIKPDKNYVITDIRYPNELKAIQKKGGIVYRINTNDNPDKYHSIDNQNLDIENSIYNCKTSKYLARINKIIPNNNNIAKA